QAQLFNGVATFDNLSISKSGTYSLIASVGNGVPDQTSEAFNIFDTLRFKVQPSDVVAGTTISPGVEVDVLRPDGQVDTNFTDNVSLALGDDPSKGIAKVSGNIHVVATAGIATFSDLSIDVGGVGYSLVASLAEGTKRFSDFFNVAHILEFKTQPSNSFARGTIAPFVEVNVENAN